MRRRITRALVATAAAGATITTLGFAAAGSAGAVTAAHKPTHVHFAPSGTVVGTGGPNSATTLVAASPCATYSAFLNTPGAGPLNVQSFGGGGCVGYIPTDRTVRYAQAIATIPQSNVIPLSSTTPSATPGVNLRTNVANAAAPSMLVALTSGDALAGVGIFSCFYYVLTLLSVAPATGSTALCAPTAQTGPPLGPDYYPAQWVAVGWVITQGGPLLSHATTLAGLSGGDGVKLSVYYPGSAAHFVITTNPTTTAAATTSFQLPGPGNTLNAVFDHADALVDYSSSATVTASSGVTPVTESSPVYPLNPGPASGTSDLRITQFLTGAWTTTNGTRGTFHGPWTLTAPVLTSNGALPPSGATDVEPAYLWNDGMGNGWGDAFGVWWRH